MSAASGQKGRGSDAWWSSTRTISSTERFARSAMPLAGLSPGVQSLRSISLDARRALWRLLVSSLALSLKYARTGIPSPLPGLCTESRDWM